MSVALAQAAGSMCCGGRMTRSDGDSAAGSDSASSISGMNSQQWYAYDSTSVCARHTRYTALYEYTLLSTAVYCTLYTVQYLDPRQYVGRVEAAQVGVVVRLQMQQALQAAARQPRELVVAHIPAHDIPH